MGFGKAQKQARNLAKKKAKIKAAQERELALINSLDDSRQYEGFGVYNGIHMTGKQWKELHSLNCKKITSNTGVYES